MHACGRVIDVNNAYDGDGPFAPERAGGIPAGQLVELCFSGKYTKEQIQKKLVGQAGMVAYLDTNDMRKTRDLIQGGDERAQIIFEAMAYQVAKEAPKKYVIWCFYLQEKEMQALALGALRILRGTEAPKTYE